MNQPNKFTRCTECARPLFSRDECAGGVCGSCTRHVYRHPRKETDAERLRRQCPELFKDLPDGII